MPHNEMPDHMHDPNFVKPEASPVPPSAKGPFGQCGVAPSGTIERPKGLMAQAGVQPSGIEYKEYEPVPPINVLPKPNSLQPIETVPRRFLIQVDKDCRPPTEEEAEKMKEQLDRWGREGGSMLLFRGFLIFGEHNGQWVCLNSVINPPVAPTPQLPLWRRIFGASR